VRISVYDALFAHASAGEHLWGVRQVRAGK
jgi:hypothetical protein